LTAKTTGFDSSGKPAYVDPTANVVALNEASVKRMDDLMSAESRRVSEHLAWQEKFLALQADHLRDAEEIRAHYHDQLAAAESKRIDAIRAVDVNNVAVASERASAQATVLANQFTQTSESLRTLIGQTAASLMDRLSKVEQAQYEGKGRQAFTDPRIEELMSRVEGLSVMGATGAGKGQGMNALWAYIVAGVSILFGFGGLVMALLKMKS